MVRRTGLPSDVTTNELDDGIEARTPVVHVIDVAVLADIGQSMPSILTDNAEPKFVPVMVKTVPPMLGPNFGLNPVMVDVLVCE